MRDATPFKECYVTFRTTKQWTHTSVPRELKRDFRFSFSKQNFKIVILDEYHTEIKREDIHTEVLEYFHFFSLLLLLLFARLIRKVNKSVHTHLL